MSGVPTGPATRPNNNFNGAAPSLAFVLAIDPVEGAWQVPHPAPTRTWASTSLDSTSLDSTGP